MSTRSLDKRARRQATTLALAVGGLAVTIALWVGGDHPGAVVIGVFYLVAVVVAAGWSRGSGDVAAIIRLEGDERQRQLDLKATAVAGGMLILVCLVAMAVDLAQGGDGQPYTWLCAAAGLTYAIALAALRRRG
jgi:hypothetical protein